MKSDYPYIANPVRVSRDRVDTYFEIPNSEAWQQPLWGWGAKLWHGLQDRFNPEHTYKTVIKPGKRYDMHGELLGIEPTGEHGTSWDAYLDILRDVYRKGHHAENILEVLLASDLLVGPTAQHAWQMTKSGGTTEWFYSLWSEIANSETSPKHQRRANKSNSTYPEGPITFNQPYQYREDLLERLRLWVLEHPELNQSQIKARCSVFKDRRQIVNYLEELERQDRALHEFRKTSGRGRPSKYWVAVPTAEDLEREQRWDEQTRQQLEVGRQILTDALSKQDAAFLGAVDLETLGLSGIMD